MHYATNGEAVTDRTKVGLVFATAHAPLEPSALPVALAARTRELRLPCGDQRLPLGRLLAVRPHLDRGCSVGSPS